MEEDSYKADGFLLYRSSDITSGMLTEFIQEFMPVYLILTDESNIILKNYLGNPHHVNLTFKN
jgi:hypothetical protein